jgi:single-stranded-DNA-specific exonuclease
MEVLAEKPRPGLASLMKKAGVGSNSIGSGDIGFQVAPRINAAGRVGDPRLAVQLLLEKDPGKISSLTEELESANSLRKEISEKVFQEARRQAEEQLANGRKSLVIAGNDWHHGVTGLVTGRLANIYYRPTIVFSIDQHGVARGSARSINEVNILEAVSECSSLLVKYGGHKGAAGLTMKSEGIGEFQEKFETSVDRIIGDLDLTPTIQVNLKASINELLEDKFLQFYRRLEPFGPGNPEPVFCFKDEEKMLFTEARKIGRDSLRFKVNENGLATQGVAFGMADFLTDINNGGGVNMAFRLNRNEFRGRIDWQLMVEDIKSVSLSI